MDGATLKKGGNMGELGVKVMRSERAAFKRLSLRSNVNPSVS